MGMSMFHFSRGPSQQHRQVTNFEMRCPASFIAELGQVGSKDFEPPAAVLWPKSSDTGDVAGEIQTPTWAEIILDQCGRCMKMLQVEARGHGPTDPDLATLIFIEHPFSAAFSLVGLGRRQHPPANQFS